MAELDDLDRELLGEIVTPPRRRALDDDPFIDRPALTHSKIMKTTGPYQRLSSPKKTHANARARSGNAVSPCSKKGRMPLRPHKASPITRPSRGTTPKKRAGPAKTPDVDNDSMSDPFKTPPRVPIGDQQGAWTAPTLRRPIFSQRTPGSSPVRTRAQTRIWANLDDLTAVPGYSQYVSPIKDKLFQINDPGFTNAICEFARQGVTPKTITRCLDDILSSKSPALGDNNEKGTSPQKRKRRYSSPSPKTKAVRIAGLTSSDRTLKVGFLKTPKRQELARRATTTIFNPGEVKSSTDEDEGIDVDSGKSGADSDSSMINDSVAAGGPHSNQASTAELLTAGHTPVTAPDGTRTHGCGPSRAAKEQDAQGGRKNERTGRGQRTSVFNEDFLKSMTIDAPGDGEGSDDEDRKPPNRVPASRVSPVPEEIGEEEKEGDSEAKDASKDAAKDELPSEAEVGAAEVEAVELEAIEAVAVELEATELSVAAEIGSSPGPTIGPASEQEMNTGDSQDNISNASECSSPGAMIQRRVYTGGTLDMIRDALRDARTASLSSNNSPEPTNDGLTTDTARAADGGEEETAAIFQPDETSSGHNAVQGASTLESLNDGSNTIVSQDPAATVEPTVSSSELNQQSSTSVTDVPAAEPDSTPRNRRRHVSHSTLPDKCRKCGLPYPPDWENRRCLCHAEQRVNRAAAALHGELHRDTEQSALRRTPSGMRQLLSNINESPDSPTSPQVASAPATGRRPDTGLSGPVVSVWSSDTEESVSRPILGRIRHSLNTAAHLIMSSRRSSVLGGEPKETKSPAAEADKPTISTSPPVLPPVSADTGFDDFVQSLGRSEMMGSTSTPPSNSSGGLRGHNAPLVVGRVEPQVEEDLKAVQATRRRAFEQSLMPAPVPEPEAVSSTDDSYSTPLGSGRSRDGRSPSGLSDAQRQSVLNSFRSFEMHSIGSPIGTEASYTLQDRTPAGTLAVDQDAAIVALSGPEPGPSHRERRDNRPQGVARPSRHEEESEDLYGVSDDEDWNAGIEGARPRYQPPRPARPLRIVVPPAQPDLQSPSHATRASVTTEDTTQQPIGSPGRQGSDTGTITQGQSTETEQALEHEVLGRLLEPTYQALDEVVARPEGEAESTPATPEPAPNVPTSINQAASGPTSMSDLNGSILGSMQDVQMGETPEDNSQGAVGSSTQIPEQGVFQGGTPPQTPVYTGTVVDSDVEMEYTHDESAPEAEQVVVPPYGGTPSETSFPSAHSGDGHASVEAAQHDTLDEVVQSPNELDDASANNVVDNARSSTEAEDAPHHDTQQGTQNLAELGNDPAADSGSSYSTSSGEEEWTASFIATTNAGEAAQQRRGIYSPRRTTGSGSESQTRSPSSREWNDAMSATEQRSEESTRPTTGRNSTTTSSCFELGTRRDENVGGGERTNRRSGLRSERKSDESIGRKRGVTN
ncbi:MAG: hypothetical protein M1817_001617 [Caeruleum heppii]|nr:MAG: hypothetical protein M1817_001617 [Caeruleum heppii]